MDSTLSSSELNSHTSFKVQGYYELSHSYMNISSLMLEEGLTQPCLILGCMSVKAMLNAVYLHHCGRNIFIDQISFDELLFFARDQNIINWDTELFLNSIYFLTRPENITSTSKFGQEHIGSILSRINSCIGSFSKRILKIEK